jgi:hypothetical protein
VKNLFVFWFCFFTVQLFAQPTRTVKFSPAIDGVANYNTITEALNGATSGTVIWVAAGTYQENELVVPSGVTLIGGFPVNATSLQQRIYPGNASSSQQSILDGSNSHRVVTVYGTVDGFVICNGFAYDPTGNTPINGAGAGALIDGGIVQNCIIRNNQADVKSSYYYDVAIGDFYCTDGTILHPTYQLDNSTGKITVSLNGGIPSGKTVQGIVFYVDPQPNKTDFYIMAKPVNKQPWFNPSLDFDLANVTTMDAAMNDFNGYNNSIALDQSFKKWHEQNPGTWYEGWDDDNPVPYCLNYDTPSGTKGQWYLPAAGEIYKLWEVHDQMDAGAVYLGWISSGQTMFTKGYYWSSTEYDANYAWVLDTNSYPWGTWGLSNTQSKTGGGYAVPVSKKSLTE